jgi:chondroitin AC lyase
VPFWNIVLCVQHYDYRHLTEPELRFEAMQTLAYGGKGLLWFTYWEPGGVDPNLKHAIINADGSRDPHFEMIKNINADVLAMGDELLRAESTDVFLPKDAPNGSPVTIGAENVTVGLFKSELGKPMSMIANRDYKNAIKALIVVRGDLPEQLDTRTGNWKALAGELDLAPGAAILIRWQPTSASGSTMETIRTNYIRSILPTDPAVIENIKKSADEAMRSQSQDGSWPGIDYADKRPTAWPLRAHLNRLQVMARGNHLARNPKLVEAIRKGLTFWLDRDPQNPNWWWNRIGVPQYLGETLLLAQGDLSADLVAHGVEIMKRSDWSKWTGQNLVWGTGIQVMRGIIQQDESVVEQAYARMYEEIRQVPPGREGIQADWSFHQHGTQFYSGGYGLDFGNDVGRFIAYSCGTALQIPAEKMRIYSSYLLDGQQWMIRGATFDYSAVGREITRAGKSAINRAWLQGPATPKGAAYSVGNVAAMIASLDTPRKTEFEAFAARLHGDDDRSPLVGNRHFWCSDYMAHRRAGYLASVKMFSTRLWNTEEINAEGRRSHHLADGAMFLYRRDDEYRDIFPVWDWGRVPGTTAEQGDLNTILPRGNHERGKTEFVGGVSDGMFGMCTMDLERGALSAKKLWAMFDDVIVCLGAGINCTSDNPVVTSINQCNAYPETFHELVDGAVHEGIAYSATAKVHAGIAKQTGRWSDIGAGSTEELSKDVFSIWIDHGPRPSNATYEYFIMPGASDSSRVRQVQVLSNTPELQAVAHKRLGILAIAFRAPGEIAGIEVDQPCLILRRGNMLSVSNPRNSPLTVNLKINGRSLNFELPDGPSAGSTVTRQLPL